MRLVVDTNVFVSAALKENSLPFLVVRWIEQYDGLLKSAATERQLSEVLARPYIVAATIPALREGVARILDADSNTIFAALIFFDAATIVVSNRRRTT